MTDQFDAIIAFFLREPRVLDPGTSSISRAETHISVALLTDTRVFKFKKPVSYPFLDQVRLADRKRFCEEEVRLNSRLSPEVYRGVHAIQESGGRYSIGEGPRTIEYCVEMVRLEAERCLVDLARRDQLSETEIDAISFRLADFHDDCEPVQDQGLHRVEANLEENIDAMEGAGAPPELSDAMRQVYRESHALIRRREAEGKIVDGHGDLRLDHIYLYPGAIRIVDCVDFSARLRAVDPYEDLASATVSLRMEGCPRLADWLGLGYAWYTADAEGCALLRFYELYRASVRAKVDGLQLRDGPAERRRYCGERFQRYLRLIEDIHRRRPRAPRLIGIAGLPLTGKTTYARRLSLDTGAPVVSTDVVRKRLLKLRPTERAAKAHYGAATTRRTYDRCRELAGGLLRAGHGVIVEGTFAKAEDRRRLTELAEACNVPVEFHEVTAAESTIEQRIERRRREESVSDLTDMALWRSMAQAYEPFAEGSRIRVRGD